MRALGWDAVAFDQRYRVLAVVLPVRRQSADLRAAVLMVV